MGSKTIRRIMLDAFEQNKYCKWYVNIINNAILRETKGIDGEYHHILPKSCYPEFQKEKCNLVLLTFREHFICHLLLPKFIKNSEHRKKMIYGFRMILLSRKKLLSFRTKSSRWYELMKISHKEMVSTKMKGKIVSIQTREKLSKAHKGKIVSEKTRNGCRERAKNKSLNHKSSLSAHMKNLNVLKQKKVTDGIHIFDSIKKCGDYYRISPEAISYRVKSNKYPEFKYVI